MIIGQGVNVQEPATAGGRQRVKSGSSPIGNLLGSCTLGEMVSVTWGYLGS